MEEEEGGRQKRLPTVFFREAQGEVRIDPAGEFLGERRGREMVGLVVIGKSGKRELSEMERGELGRIARGEV